MINPNNVTPIWETNLKTAGKVYAFTILSAMLCLLVHMGLFMLAESGLTVRYGDRVIQQLANGTTTRMDLVYTLDAQNNRVLDKNGKEILTLRQYILDENKQWKLISEERKDPDAATATTTAATGTTTTGDPATKVVSVQNSAIRTPLSPGNRVLFDNVSQILMLLLFVCFPYSILWELGNNDRNKVQFNRLTEDKYRGLTIGLLADIPAFAAYLYLIIAKIAGLGFSQYRTLNFSFISIFNFIIPENIKNPAAASIWAILLWFPILLILPLMTVAGYALGYRDISLKDKLVYKTTGHHTKPKKRS